VPAVFVRPKAVAVKELRVAGDPRRSANLRAWTAPLPQSCGILLEESRQQLRRQRSGQCRG